MSSAIGAGMGADMLQEILKQKFREVIAQKELAERARANDLQHSEAQQQIGLGRDRLGLDTQKLGEDTRQFDVSSGQRDRTIQMDEQMQPVRIANTQAQTGELLRRPKAEQEERDYGTTRDKTRHGYEMQQIGAQGANALKIANVRHPDGSGPAAAAQVEKEQNEVQDSLALIQQIRGDKALSTATGPIDARGLGMVRDLEGVTRVKALHDNLVNKMQLAQAGKLKGQGQISNMEREMLKNAATALDLKLGDPDYLNELAKVEQQFQRMLGGPRAAPSGAASGAPSSKETPEQRIKRLLGGG